MSDDELSTVQDLLSYVREAAASVEAREVEAWQAKLKPGDFVVRFVNDQVLFSEVLDPVAQAEAYDEDVEEVREQYAQPHMQHFRSARSYSAQNPEGEYGDFHLSSAVVTISKDLFEKIRAAGWQV